MFKLSLKLSALGIFTALAAVLVIGMSPRNENDFFAAAQDKHRLLHTIPAPRIILVGGSNAGFSIDGAHMAQVFNMPVINTGLQINLGLRFMLNEVENALQARDIVFIFPEYEHFYHVSLDGNPVELGKAIKYCPECMASIDTPRQLAHVLTGFLQTAEPDLLQGVSQSKSGEKVYLRNGFDAYGNMTAHLKQGEHTSHPKDHVLQIEILSPNPAIQLLNSFYKRYKDTNQIFIIYPAVPQAEYEAQSEGFAALQNLLASELEIPTAGKPQEFLYPANYFYDTVYHLNGYGRAIHTERVIQTIRPMIGK